MYPSTLRPFLFRFAVVLALAWVALMVMDDVTARSKRLRVLTAMLWPVGCVSLAVWLDLLRPTTSERTFDIPGMLPFIWAGLAGSLPGAAGTLLYLHWRKGPDLNLQAPPKVRIVGVEWTPDSGKGALLVLRRHRDERAWVSGNQAAPQGPGTVSISLDGRPGEMATSLRWSESSAGVHMGLSTQDAAALTLLPETLLVFADEPQARSAAIAGLAACRAEHAP